MIALVFSYEVRDAEAFERAYGADGDWAQFFRAGRGYIGTELLRDVELPGRYLVIDRWESAEAYNAFAAEHRDDYMRRVDDTRFLYEQELRFGTFENVWQKRVIPPHHDPACWGCGDAPGGIRLPQPAAEGADASTRRGSSSTSATRAGRGSCTAGSSPPRSTRPAACSSTWYRFPAVTARIFVRYRRPVAINTELLVRATLTGERGRRLHADGRDHRRHRRPRGGARRVPPRSARALPRDPGGTRVC